MNSFLINHWNAFCQKPRTYLAVRDIFLRAHFIHPHRAFHGRAFTKVLPLSLSLSLSLLRAQGHVCSRGREITERAIVAPHPRTLSLRCVSRRRKKTTRRKVSLKRRRRIQGERKTSRRKKGCAAGKERLSLKFHW